jgi:hypothetical protein
MKKILSVFTLIMIISGCVEKFIPETQDSHFFIVVNGIITNQPEVYTIKLSWSYPLGEKVSVPLPGCDVTVQDDLGNVYQFTESTTPGTYNSDKNTFQGVVGRKYKLRIVTNNATPKHHSYESGEVEMKAVPPIDSLYYEKVIIKEETPFTTRQEGCQIYLSTVDPTKNCRFFRWNYTETWEIHVPYIVTNKDCWVSNNSNNIDIKNTSALSEDRVIHYPLLFISNETDRLSRRYSILVNQYSISNEEYAYWEKIQNVTQNVGGLYDYIPSSIASNLFCAEDPGEKVLGYFSVSAKTSKRIYIDEAFSGLVNIYKNCMVNADTFGLDVSTIPGLNVYRWIIYVNAGDGYLITTWHRECADCTARGTAIKPEFWEDAN